MEDSLQPGDHIFTCRALGYCHHGIYVGEVEGVKYVIHFTATVNKSFPSSVSSFPLSVSSFSSSVSSFSSSVSVKAGCIICGYVPDVDGGVVKTCLRCFLQGDSLKVKYYNSNSKPSHEVVNTAFDLLQNGFGNYDLLLHNCEHFATFCKTGYFSSEQVKDAIDGVQRCKIL